MIAFFIDADNLCSSSWVEEAIRTLELGEGSVSIRRAYGSADKLKGLGDVLRTALIRPYMNLSLSKNTTDIALAVDVMEMSFAPSRPTTIAIGSGDADFVPLVLRLRERGFRMVCISERGKMAPEAVYAYDKVFFVGDGAVEPANRTSILEPAEISKPPAPKKSPPAKKAPTVKTAVKKAAAPKAQTKVTASAKKTAAKKAPAKKIGTVANASASQVTVHQILESAPTLMGGQFQRLGEIAKLLHDAKLLGKNSASTKLFKKFPHHFELQPQKQPNQVRYVLPPS
ncbi:MAG: NYN domain-containing protein [Acidovorax sp.]|uniref:NYN domain-containing protein n=1 Tax=Acidovorax sp. TaxID=1872122 RepID=UPI00391C8163